MSNKPTTTKAAPTKAATTKAADEAQQEPVTKLAQVADPATLTDAKIADISGDDGSDDPENTANADAAEAMKQDRAEAKGKDDPTPGYFGGQGGAAGL